MSQAPAIEVKNLCVIYNEGTPNEVIALDEVCLTVERGEVIVITGGNGCGKSTLLKAIAGLIPVKSGKIYMNGKNVTDWPAYKRASEIGFVHQDPMFGTCPNLTVHENFQLAQKKPWWSPLPYSLKLLDTQLESLKKTGLSLSDKANTPVGMLSGGQRQAIALCLAFSSTHSVFLFDEFTSALDENAKEAALSFALSEADKRCANILMVMHEVKEDIADKYHVHRINKDGV